jgi:hypothetical protein
MNQELWLKRRAECAKAAPSEKPSKYILVTCRDLDLAEKRILGKNFQQIHVYNSALDHAFDLSKLAFDLMVIDASKAENHTFLEMIAPSCAGLNIPIIVLGCSLSNYKKLAEDLQAYIISRIEDLEGPNFFLFLTKTKLRKLQSRWVTVLKRLFRLLF